MENLFAEFPLCYYSVREEGDDKKSQHLSTGWLAHILKCHFIAFIKNFFTFDKCFIHYENLHILAISRVGKTNNVQGRSGK